MIHTPSANRAQAVAPGRPKPGPTGWKGGLPYPAGGVST